MLLAAGSNVPGTIGAISDILVAIGLYWLPTIIAGARHVPAKAQIVIVNLFRGWTFIGRVVALAMAFRQVPAVSGTG
jgi:hypothetical protein